MIRFRRCPPCLVWQVFEFYQNEITLYVFSDPSRRQMQFIVCLYVLHPVRVFSGFKLGSFPL